jgi:hypothetical protein
MYKRIFLTSLITVILLVTGHISVLLIVDPLSINKIRLSAKEFYIKEMRFQAAGLINNEKFDSAIVGTSMAANFQADEANTFLGGAFINLSLDGSLLTERYVVLKHLLNNKNIKTLIISLDGATENQRNKGIPIDSWAFLYNDNYFDDFYVYTNRKYMEYLNCHSLFQNELVTAIQNISSRLIRKCPQNKIYSDTSELTGWQSDPRHNARFGGIENWIKNKDHDQIKGAIRQTRKAIEDINNYTRAQLLKLKSDEHDYNQFEHNIVPLFKENSKTKFILFFPPYSIVRYAIDYQSKPSSFNNYREYVQKVVLEAEKHSNVKIYWFSDYEFINDIANYKDNGHYHGKFNSMFLNIFGNENSNITSQNHKVKLEKLESRAKEFNLSIFAENFKE